MNPEDFFSRDNENDDTVYDVHHWVFDPDDEEEFVSAVRELVESAETYHDALIPMGMVLSVVADHEKYDFYLYVVQRTLDEKFADDMAEALGWNALEGGTST